MPATMTKSTMKTLSATSAMLTRIDSWMPIETSTVRTATSRKAGRSKCEP